MKYPSQSIRHVTHTGPDYIRWARQRLRAARHLDIRERRPPLNPRKHRRRVQPLEQARQVPPPLHPQERAEPRIARLAGRKVELACVVTNVARQISRRDNSEWGKVTVEDFHGTATVLAFKDIWQAAKETLVEDAVVLLKGQVSDRDRDAEDPPIFLDEVRALEELPSSGALAVQIELPIGADLDPGVFARAKEILAAHPGATPVELTLGADNGAPAPRFRSRSLSVDPMNGTMPALRELFGAGRVRLVRRGGVAPEPPAGFMAP